MADKKLITSTQEGVDLKPKSLQMKLHRIQQLAHAGEEQNASHLPKLLILQVFSNF